MKRKWAIGPAVANAGLSFSYAYLQPIPQLRYFAIASGVLSLSMLPMTLALGLLPINSELTALGEKVNKRQDVDWQQEGKKVDDLVRQWQEKHELRFVPYVGAWVAAVAVLVSSL